MYQITPLKTISPVSVFADKQQELDIPTFKVEDHIEKKQDEEDTADDLQKLQKSPMTQISGIRKLKHANSVTTGNVPQYGVETENPIELNQVPIYIL